MLPKTMKMKTKRRKSWRRRERSVVYLSKYVCMYVCTYIFMSVCALLSMNVWVCCTMYVWTNSFTMYQKIYNVHMFYVCCMYVFMRVFAYAFRSGKWNSHVVLVFFVSLGKSWSAMRRWRIGCDRRPGMKATSTRRGKPADRTITLT